MAQQKLGFPEKVILEIKKQKQKQGITEKAERKVVIN